MAISPAQSSWNCVSLQGPNQLDGADEHLCTWNDLAQESSLDVAKESFLISEYISKYTVNIQRLL